MALANKYKTTYCDVFGNTCEVYILQEGYVGGVTELEAQASPPFAIQYDADDDFKFSPIRTSRCEINLVLGNGIDLDEFFTQNERDYQIEHYIAGVLDWRGWIIPNGFQYQLTGGLYYATIEGTDGLELLDSQKFINDATGNNYGIDDIGVLHNDFNFTFLLILAECLKKTGLNLDFWVGIDVYEKSHTPTDADSDLACPLRQTYVNVRTYIQDSDEPNIPYWKFADEAFDTFKVLENLCLQFGAKLYQEKGTWRLKRVNADLDPGTGATTRYFYKFTSNAAYISPRVPIAENQAIECLSADGLTALIGTDHTVAMDQVYKKFRVNYEFTYARFGDSNINLIKNGNFAESWDNVSRSSAPPNWVRFREGTKWFPKLQNVIIPLGDRSGTGGISDAIEFGTQPLAYDPADLDPNASIWAGLKTEETFGVNEGDQFYFKFFGRFIGRIISEIATYAVMFQVKLMGDNGDVYFLSTKYETMPSGGIMMNGGQAAWQKMENLTDELFFAATYFHSSNFAGILQGDPDVYTYEWLPFNIKFDPIPTPGKMDIAFHGLAATSGRDSDNFPAFKVFGKDGDTLGVVPAYKTVRLKWKDDGGDIERLQITGVALTPIPDTSDRPESFPYIYENTDSNYSLQVDPIELLHGDTISTLAISGITVPNNDGRNFWDVIDGRFGYSSSGLVLAKSIMEIYGRPRKILEGTAKAPDSQFGSLYTFAALPGINFVLQRGRFNRKEGYIEDATFVELSSVAIDAANGTESGLDTSPIWSGDTDATRARPSRCAVDGGGLYTGQIEALEEDVNPNSETLGTLRWVNVGADIISCPIGSAPQYFIGEDDATLDTLNMVESLPYDNSPGDGVFDFLITKGRGTYLYFLHLTTISDVTGIRTKTQTEVVSDFTYQANVNINGISYRVLRLDYITEPYRSKFRITF